MSLAACAPGADHDELDRSSVEKPGSGSIYRSRGRHFGVLQDLFGLETAITSTIYRGAGSAFLESSFGN
jgi:hypothetical protein